jgi:hypothetical protein
MLAREAAVSVVDLVEFVGLPLGVQARVKQVMPARNSEYDLVRFIT